MKYQKSFWLKSGVVDRIKNVRELLNANLKDGERQWSEAAVTNFLLSTNEYVLDDNDILYYTKIYDRGDERSKKTI